MRRKLVFLLSGAFFVLTPFAFGYWARFIVNTPSFSATLGSMESSGVDFSVSHDSNFSNFEGETPYYITPASHCNARDGNFECIDFAPNLCPYLTLEPKDGEATETGFTQNPHGNQATGELNYPADQIDNWNLLVKSPCFEGECSPDYDQSQNGLPLPQSQKGQTFRCDLSVDSSEIPDLVKNYLMQNFVYADDLQNVIEVSATLTGEMEVCTVDCFSNVLFLPGIKGSVLKKGSDTVWPPTIFSLNDVAELAIDDGGNSVNDIHTDGILNNFLSTSIYSPFSDFMNEISGEGELINKWLPLAYDWRFSPDTILAYGIKTKDETLDVIEEVKNLAKNSKTGKVTIVAHSMGGLFGKAIIKKLQDEGKDDLIDSFVMVGTPQLGTPQVLASLLHGDGENILIGLIVNPIGIRRIAQNMPSVYNLLPSSAYFDKVSDPIIKFDADSAFTQAWRDFWGLTINTYSSFVSFVTGAGVSRSEPVEQNLQDPEVLKTDLLTDAANFHYDYDDYQLPEHIRVVQVAGWGIPTTKAIEYKNYHGAPSYKTNFTVEGDEAVVYPSAISSIADETYFFDLEKYRKSENISIKHRNLLNSVPVKNILMSVVKKINIAESNFILTIKPQATDINDQLIISTHSPVILGAYDQAGNFTGIDPNQDLSLEILSFSEDIPGSSFMYTSGSQYIFLPKEGNYNFVYQGTGNGSTTVEIQDFSADVETPIASYTDIPTTSNTEATFTVESSAPEATEIALDLDGNGEVQTISADGAEPSLSELIILIKQKISSLVAKDKLKQNLLKQISSLEKKIENKKQKNLKILDNLEKKISKQEIKGKIESADANSIIALLDILEAQAESVALDPTILDDLKLKIQSLNIKTNLKNDLLKRVERLENKQRLIKALSNLSKNILKKSEKGKINDVDAQVLIDFLHQIENVI